MGMVVSGSGIDSAECRELRAKWRERVQQYDDMDAMLKFASEDAFIEFEHNGRTLTPYLVLMGRPVSVEADFPWDVSGVEYANKLDRKLVAYRYEFTRENLADLAMKGMFEQGFEPPEVLRQNTFELPCTVSCVAIGPESESDFPVVFVSLNPGSLVCDDNMSGYTIHEYFDEMPEREPDDLVYESAVARTLPYENALKAIGEQLKSPVKAVPVQDTPAAERAEEESKMFAANAQPKPDVQEEKPSDSQPESRSDAFDDKQGFQGAASEKRDAEPSTPVYRPVPEPVPEKIDRKQAVEEMGGPDEELGDDGFFKIGDTEYE